MHVHATILGEFTYVSKLLVLTGNCFDLRVLPSAFPPGIGGDPLKPALNGPQNQRGDLEREPRRGERQGGGEMIRQASLFSY